MPRPQILLAAIVVALTAIDTIWLCFWHFDVDTRGYGGIALLTIFFAAGGIYYEQARKEERLGAMLIGTSFLLGMSASFSVLNYLLLTVAGRRIDIPLAAFDRALGFDWSAMMALTARHPLVAIVMQLAYVSVLPQVAVLVTLLGLFGRHERIYTFCIALTAGAAICMTVWTLAPSFGAFSVYELPANVARHLPLALDRQYAKALVGLLAHGPGHMSPTDAKGLIGFPSFHAVMALLVAWYAHELVGVRWFALGLNAVVIVATPIEGGHHVVDVIAGFAVAALVVTFASWVMRRNVSRHGAIAVKVQPATT